MNVEWKAQGLCSTPPGKLIDWFPERGSGYKAAKALCKKCPVSEQCLNYALDTYEMYGIWGGTSENQRRRLRGERVAKPRQRPIDHGTLSGYRAHLRRDEKPCVDCRRAHARYWNDHRPVIEKPCAHCGETFGSTKAIYCSERCRKAGHRKRRGAA